MKTLIKNNQFTKDVWVEYLDNEGNKINVKINKGTKVLFQDYEEYGGQMVYVELDNNASVLLNPRTTFITYDGVITLNVSTTYDLDTSLLKDFIE